MYPILMKNILLVEGYKAYGIYDLNKGKFFRVSKDAGEFLVHLNNKKKLENFSNKERKFIEECYNKKIINYSEYPKERSRENIEDLIKKYRHLRFAWLEITSKCNHNCLHCFLGKDLNRFDHVNLDIILRSIDVLNDKGISQLIISGGEPLLHPDIEEIIKYASKYPINLTILTNGTTSKALELADLIKKNDIKVKVSILGTEEVHDKIVGVKGSFRKLINTCKLYKKIGIDFELGYTINSLNINDVKYVKNIADNLGVFIEFSPLYNLGNAIKNRKDLLSNSQSEIIKVCRENKSNIKIERRKNPLKRPIRESDYSAVDLKNFLTDSHECGQKIIAVQCSGLVSPCLLIRDEDNCIGNINNIDLSDLLNYDFAGRARFNSTVKLDKMNKCRMCETRFICKGGGCIAASYSIYKNFLNPNPYYSKCFYKDDMKEYSNEGFKIYT